MLPSHPEDLKEPVSNKLSDFEKAAKLEGWLKYLWEHSVDDESMEYEILNYIKAMEASGNKWISAPTNTADATPARFGVMEVKP